jgi:hypothetical protein
MRILKVIVFLLLAVSLGFSKTSTCHHGKALLWANPQLHQGITMLCLTPSGGWLWAVAIYGTHEDWQNGDQKVADGYLPIHEGCTNYKCEPYIPILKNSKQLRCLFAGNTIQCLTIKYGKVGETDGKEWAEVTLDGYQIQF